MEVLHSLLSCATLSPRAHPHPGPPRGLSTEQPDRSLLVPQHRDTQDPARGCRSAPLTRDRRPEPVPRPNPSHPPPPTPPSRQGPSETQGKTRILRRCLPRAQTKTGLGKVGPTGSSRRRITRPLGLSARAGDALARSQPTFPGSFGATCWKLGREGSGGVKGSARGWSRPAAGADLPEYLLMYPSPSPSHVWKRRRIRSSSPVLDVSLLLLPAPPLLPPLALPAAAIMRPLLLAGRTRCRWRIREAPKRVAAGNLPGDGACPVAAGRSGRGSPPLRVLPGLGRWAFCDRGSRHLRGEGGEEGAPESGSPGWRRGREGRGYTGGALERCQLRASGREAGPGHLGAIRAEGGCSPRRTLPTACSHEFPFREQNKRYLFCKLKAVLLVPLCKLRGVLHP